MGSRYTGGEALSRREADHHRLQELRSIVHDGLRAELQRRERERNPGVSVEVLVTRHEQQRVNAQRQDEIVNAARRNRNKRKKGTMRELIARRRREMRKCARKKIPWTRPEDEAMSKYWDRNGNDWKGMAIDLENVKGRLKKRKNNNVGWFSKDNGQVQDRVIHLKKKVRKFLDLEEEIRPGELVNRMAQAQRDGLNLYANLQKASPEALIPPPIQTDSDSDDDDDQNDDFLGDDFDDFDDFDDDAPPPPPARRRRDDDDDEDDDGGTGRGRDNTRPRGSLRVDPLVGGTIAYATMSGYTEFANAQQDSFVVSNRADFSFFLVALISPLLFAFFWYLAFPRKRRSRSRKQSTRKETVVSTLVDGGFLIALLLDLRKAEEEEHIARRGREVAQNRVNEYLAQCEKCQYDVTSFQAGLRKRNCYDIYTSNPGPRARRYAIQIRPDDETNPYRQVQRANPRIQNLHLSTRVPDTIQQTKYRVDDFLEYVDKQNDEIELINLGLQVEGDDRFLPYLDPSRFSREQMEEYLFQYCSRGTVKYDTLHHYSLRLKSFFDDAFPDLRPNPCSNLKDFFAGLKRQQILRGDADRLIKSRALTPDVAYDCWCYIELAFHLYEESDNGQKIAICRDALLLRKLRNYMLVALGLLTGIRPFALWTIYARDVRVYRNQNYFSVSASEDKRFDSVSEVYKNDYHFFPGPTADSINRRFAVMMKTWLNIRDLSNELALQNQMRGAVPSPYLFFPLLLDGELGTQKKHRAAAIGEMLQKTLRDAVDEERLNFRLHDGSIDRHSRITAYSMRYTVASGLHGCGMYQTDIEKWLHWSSKAKTSDTYIDRSYSSPYFSQFSKYLYSDIRDQYNGHNVPGVERDLAELREDRRRRVQMNLWNRR